MSHSCAARQILQTQPYTGTRETSVRGATSPNLTVAGRRGNRETVPAAVRGRDDSESLSKSRAISLDGVQPI